jgi:predicted DNA-binding transcriptional regulator AlpA
MVAVEYLVRERQELAPSPESKSSDLHGLTKPVYTVNEVASILGTSRSSVYELARRGAGISRLGRRVLAKWPKGCDCLEPQRCSTVAAG